MRSTELRAAIFWCFNSVQPQYTIQMVGELVGVAATKPVNYIPTYTNDTTGIT